jgi:hypothetical protein
MHLLLAVSEVAIAFACVLGLVHLGSRARQRSKRKGKRSPFSDKSH